MTCTRSCLTVVVAGLLLDPEHVLLSHVAIQRVAFHLRDWIRRKLIRQCTVDTNRPVTLDS